MTNKLIGSIASALVGAAMAVFFASTADAATNTPYQRYLNGSCPGLICLIDFPAVPAGKRLEISNASCYVRLDNTSFTNEGFLYAEQLIVKTAGGGNASAVTLSPFFVDQSSDYRLFSSNDQLFLYATAGQHVQAYVQISRGIFRQVACSISGQLITP